MRHPEKIGSPTRRDAAAARSLTPTSTDRRANAISKTEDLMLDHHIRTRTWLVDLAAINAEMQSKALFSPPIAEKRRRILKPLWEG